MCLLCKDSPSPLLQLAAYGTASEIFVQLLIRGRAVDTSPDWLLLAARQVETSLAVMSVLASSERRVGQQSSRTSHLSFSPRRTPKTVADHFGRGLLAILSAYTTRLNINRRHEAEIRIWWVRGWLCNLLAEWPLFDSADDIERTHRRFSVTWTHFHV